MSQPPDDLPMKEFLRHARRLGQQIDGQAIKRSDEAVDDHERRMHPEQYGKDHPPSDEDPITDEIILSVMLQADREHAEPSYICELRDISWGKFYLALQDYERRRKEEERKLRFGW